MREDTGKSGDGFVRGTRDIFGTWFVVARGTVNFREAEFMNPVYIPLIALLLMHIPSGVQAMDEDGIDAETRDACEFRSNQ